MIITPIIFLFIFTLLCAKNIRYGICAIIFSMPLYLVRFSVGGIPTTVLEMMVYILFLVWALGKIKKNNSYPALADGLCDFSRPCKNKILLIGIMLLFLGVIISTFSSSDLKTSLGIFKGWFVDPFLFFIIFINVIKKEEHLISVLKSWLASGVVVSLIGVFYLLNNSLTFDGRLKAFFLSPNHLAMYLSPVFLVGLLFLLSKRNLDGKVFSIKYLVLSILLLIIFVSLYFTYSYGAFLGIFAAIIYLFIFRVKSAQVLWSPISNIKYLIFLILISFSLIFISSKFSQIINSDNRSSFHSRLMIWNTSAEIIKDNPLFGIGPGTFQDVYLSYSEKFDEPYLEWAVPQPHNIFLAFYLQTGMVGFVGFILILFWFFNYRKDEAVPRLYWQIINVLMIYILIHGLVDTTYWKNDLSFMFWLVVGMMIVLRKIMHEVMR